MSNELASMCPCGHGAFHHPSAAQQAMSLAATAGRYPGECKGGTHVHCRCIAAREVVIQAATPTTNPAAAATRAELAQPTHPPHDPAASAADEEAS